MQTKQCKNLGVTSRRQLVIMILRQWIGSTDGFGIKSLKTIDTIPKDKFITENDFEETINKIIRSNDYLKKEHTDINKKIEDIVSKEKFKGKSSETEVYVLEGILERERIHGLPLYGRDIELQKINNIINSSEEGNPNFLGIKGEAGVGKSRLMNEIYKKYWNPLHNFFLPSFKLKEKKRIGVIIWLFVLAAIFWSGFEQAGSSLNLFARREPGRALAMLIILFSLAGVPPMLGFFGKFYVLRAAFDAGLTWLALLGVLASVIAAFYYLRIVYFMYFGEEGQELQANGSPVLWGFLMASAAVMLLGIVNMFGVEGAAAAAAATLVN